MSVVVSISAVLGLISFGIWLYKFIRWLRSRNSPRLVPSLSQVMMPTGDCRTIVGVSNLGKAPAHDVQYEVEVSGVNISAIHEGRFAMRGRGGGMGSNFGHAWLGRLLPREFAAFEVITSTCPFLRATVYCHEQKGVQISHRVIP